MQVLGGQRGNAAAVIGDCLKPGDLGFVGGSLDRQPVGKRCVAAGQNHWSPQGLAHRSATVGEGDDALFQERPHVGDCVAGDRLHEEGDLFGEALKPLVHLVEPPHVFGGGQVGAHRLDALFGKLRVRGYVVVDRQRIAVAGKTLDLECRIDQRVAWRERGVLASGDGAALGNRERHPLDALAQQFPLQLGSVGVQPFGGQLLARLHFYLLVHEPFGQPLLAALVLEQPLNTPA